jgi:hypothetical protein
MNHAFIMQVHTYPELFGDILKQLEAPNHYFFINIDEKIDDKLFLQEALNIENVFFLAGKKRVRVNHGGFSQIQCTLNLIEAVLSFKEKIEYIHSISGQDYPCVSNEVFDQYFLTRASDYNGFMWYDSPEEVSEWKKQKYPKRYRPYYFIDTRWTYIDKLDHIIMRVLRRTLNKLYLKPEDKNIVAGWSWFSWSYSVADYVMNYFMKNPKELRKYKYTFCCDEIIFHTLLQDKLEYFKIQKNMSIRYIVWNPKRFTTSLPLILNENEYEEIVHSDALFCRKVHPQESEMLIRMLKERISNK